MKLYRGTECEECKGEGKCYHEGDGVAYTCGKCLGLGLLFDPATPAELEALNLKAAMVLGELKREVRAWEGKTKLWNWTPRQLLQFIADLESRFPDKEVRKVLEDAEAWRRFRQENNKGFKINVNITDRMNEVLDAYQDKARAELAGKEADHE